MMKTGGNKMTGEMVAVIAILLVLGLFGIWKASTAENNDYAKYKASLLDLTSRVESAEKLMNAANTMSIEAERVSTETADKFGKLEEDVIHVQDHLARHKAEIVKLKDRSYPRHVELTVKPPTQPIQFEYYAGNPKPTFSTSKAPKVPEPPKKLMKKIKKQLQEINE